MRRTARALSAALAAGAVLALTGPAAVVAPASGTLTGSAVAARASRILTGPAAVVAPASGTLTGSAVVAARLSSTRTGARTGPAVVAAPAFGSLAASAFCDPAGGPAPVTLAATSPVLPDGAARLSRVTVRTTTGGKPGGAGPCPSPSGAPGRPLTGGHPVTRSGEAPTAPATVCVDDKPCGQDGRQNAGREGAGDVPALDGVGVPGVGIGPSAGLDGVGQDGLGPDGAGGVGAGEVGPGQVTGADGGGQDGGGTGAGRDGVGQDSGGRQSTGKDSAGRDGTGKDSAGQDGSGRECAGAGAGSCGHDGEPCAGSREATCADGRACRESHGSDSCTPAGVQHGVDAGQGGTFNDSVPALAAGATLLAAACAGAVYRLFGHRRFRGGEHAGM
ncbi:hypothetical protein [Streptomyces sp. NPDC052721]|uniref:hypothetical protein n=1 Tax=Streptomyces sp. NPDC052721 TaxID=3154955 RepID=UPI00344AA303